MKYHLSIRILHWFTGALLLFVLGLGIYMVGLESQLKGNYYFLHKALGSSIIALFVLRAVIRLIVGSPKQTFYIPKIEQLFAAAIHLTLYLLAFAVPISGYIMSNSSGKAVKWFFDIELPTLIELNKELASASHSAHGVLPYVMLGVIALHILGTIKHIVIDNNNILKRII